MANNQYVNKVKFGDTTVIDISDTTTEAGDVVVGKTFYAKSGALTTGSLSDATQSTHGLMSMEDKVKLDNIDEIEIDKTLDTPASIQSFSDGADNLPVKTLTVGIEPVQDLHGYENPWPGGGGKNLVDNSTNIVGGYYNGSGAWITDNNSATSALVPVLPNTTYVSSIFQKNGTYINNLCATLWDDESTCTAQVTSASFTTGASTKFVRVRNFVGDSSYIIGNDFLFQLEAGSTHTTYAPYSNICPISGWTGANVTRTGRNVWDEQWEAGAYDEQTGEKRFNSNAIRSKNYIPVFPNTVYYAVFPALARIFTYDSNHSFLGSFTKQNDTFTTGANVHYITFNLGGVNTYGNNISFNYPATDTAYHAYAGTTYPISWQTEAGTVYGGTLTIHQDGSGELVVDRAVVDLGTRTWTYIQPTTSIPFGTFYNTINNKKYGQLNIICSAYPVKSGFGNDKAIQGNSGASTIYLTDSSFEGDAVALKTSLSGVQLVYELVTPVTYTLTNLEVIEMLNGLNNVWADTGDINSLTYLKQTSGLINTQDKVKINSLSPVALSGSYTDLLNKPDLSVYLTSHQDISGKANSADLATVATTGSYSDLLNKPDLTQYLTSVPTMTGATSSAAGTSGLVPAPTSGDVEKFLAGDGTYKSGGMPMVVLSYGSSTWDDFINAYNNNIIVYCKASSNSNPASGAQTRMAFMAYVNANPPTNVEFQYYRSVSSHSATQMGDQVFIYKLDKTSGWSVTTREASIKQITGSGITVAWSSNKVTLTNDITNDITTLTLTAATNVTLASQSYACIRNGFIFIYAKGQVSADITNDELFTISGSKNAYSPITIPIGIGTDWNITKIGYGFFSSKTCVGTVANGEWFHILFSVPWA